MPQTGNISVSFADFIPSLSTYEYISDVVYGLVNVDGADFFGYIPLNLPHGATITNIIYYFYDYDDDFFFFYLMRHEHDNYDYDIMEYVSNTPGSDTPGLTSLSATQIDYATVDNDNYYFIYLKVPYSSTDLLFYRFYSAVIEYTFP